MLSQVKLIAEPWDVGPGGYQVGNFPVLWSEWNGIYRDTMRDFWRLHASCGRVRLAPDRLLRPLPGRRPRPVRLDQLHHRPRRLHPRRPRRLQRQAQRGQPRGQPGRHRRQPLVELRRRGPDRRRRGDRAAGAPAKQLPRHAAALPGDPDAPRRRRDRPYPARQQQRLVPGQRDLVVRLEPRSRPGGAAGVHPAPDRAASQPPGVSSRELPRRAGDDGLGAPRCLVVPGRRTQDDPPRLAVRRAGPRPLPQRRRDHDPRSARRGDQGRLVPAPLQCARRRSDDGAPVAALRRAVGARALDRRSWGAVGVRDLPLAERGPPGLAVDRGAEAGRLEFAALKIAPSGSLALARQ